MQTRPIVSSVLGILEASDKLTPSLNAAAPAEQARHRCPVDLRQRAQRLAPARADRPGGGRGPLPLPRRQVAKVTRGAISVCVSVLVCMRVRVRVCMCVSQCKTLCASVCVCTRACVIVCVRDCVCA